MTAEPALPVRVGRRVRGLLASVRLRLVWWFVVVLAIATIGSVLVVRQILFQRLDARIDEELVQEVREVELLAAGNDPETGEPFLGDVERIFEVALERNVPARSEAILTFVGGTLTGVRAGEDGPSLDLLPIEMWASLSEAERGRLEPASGERIDFQAVPFLVDGSPAGVFVVAIDREYEARDTDAASLAAAAVGLAMLIVGSLLAFRLADRILTPVRAVRETARSITESDLSGRIPLSGYDEISDLAATFNDMLDRLDDSFAAQRQFIDDAGHELRTPITVIQGHLDTLGDDPEERARTLALLDDELGRVRRMIDDLITLARSERPDFLPRACVVEQMRPQHLGHDRGVQVIIPGDVRLEPLAATEAPQDVPAIPEERPLGEEPGIAGTRGRSRRSTPAASRVVSGIGRSPGGRVREHRSRMRSGRETDLGAG